MNKEPTQEQTKEFWEWCGFQHCIPDVVKNLEAKRYKEEQWFIPGVSCGGIPVIDLNNLFKYAVPKLMDDGISYLDIQVRRYIIPDERVTVTYHAEIWSNSGRPTRYANSKDPALALFWAIWEVKGDKE